MLCILYVIAIGTLLGLAGHLVEQSLPAGTPRRWIWCVVIAVTMLVPPIYRANHVATVGAARGMHAHDAAATGWQASVQSLDPVINDVWLAATAVLLVLGLADVLRVSLAVRRARRTRPGAGGSTTVDGVPVVVTDGIGPATVGLLRSRVLVPRWVLALPGAQRAYVIRHEEEHRRAHDARLLLVASLSLLLLPWNVPLWWQLRRLRLAVEMDCDDRVVAALGDAPAYGSLLLRVAEAASRGPRLQPALLGGAGSLERRLAALLAETPRGTVRRLAAATIAVALLAVVLALPHPVLPGEDVPAAAAAHPAR
jgi:beta-lactamase regulating signal transducer with metallopeptidase domain